MRPWSRRFATQPQRRTVWPTWSFRRSPHVCVRFHSFVAEGFVFVAGVMLFLASERQSLGSGESGGYDSAMKPSGSTKGGTLVALSDTALAGLAALLAFWLLGADDFYKADGPRLVWHLQQGNPLWPQHPFYLPILIALKDALAAWLPAPYDVALLASALGTAAGIACCRLAFAALALPRARANLATALVATCPAVLLFGCVVEIHGLFFGFVGLAFLAFALLERSVARGGLGLPSFVFAAACGALCALASAVHGSGILLGAVFAPWLLARAQRWHAFHPRNVFALVFAASFAALLFTWTDPFANRDFVEGGFGRPQGVEYLPGITWREYLLGLAPLSVLAPLAITKREVRMQALAFVLACVPYLYGALKLLVGEIEFGAYLLPLALPAAYLCTRAWPLPVLALCMVFGTSLGVRNVLRFHADEQETQLREGMRDAVATRSVLVMLGSVDEFEAILIAAPRAQLVPLDELARQAEAQIRAALPFFDQRIAAAIAKKREVWISAAGLAFLDQPASAAFPSGAVLARHIRERYRLDRCGAGSFESFRLSPN